MIQTDRVAPMTSILPGEELRQFLYPILAYKTNSRDYEQAMNQLLDWIPRQSGIRDRYNIGIDRRYCPNFEYQDALQEALAAFFQGIDRFLTVFNLTLETIAQIPADELYSGFIGWFNKILKRKAVDQYRKFNRKIKDTKTGKDIIVVVLSADAPISSENGESKTHLDNFAAPTLNDLDSLIKEEVADKFVEKLQQAMEKLSSCHVEDKPHCNCLELAQRRLLRNPPQEWKEIEKELNVPYGTITAHWKRKCKPLLQEIYQDLV